MKQIWAIGLGLLVLGLAMSGCSESVSETSVAADGSVVKVVTIREGSASGAMSMGEEPKPMTDLVKFEGQGWEITESTVNGSRILTATKRLSSWREADCGWSLVLDEKRSILGRSRIHESEGYLNFEERYSLVGEVDMAKRDSELAKMQDSLRKSWQKGELSDADAKSLSEKVRALVVRTIFGPSEPILPIFLTSPKRFEREFKKRIFGDLTSYFVGINDMSLDEAKAQAQSFIKEMDAEQQVGNPAEEAGKTDGEDGNSGNSFSISVCFKGAVVKEQNGLVDPVSDEIYWDFYSMAVEESPVVLHARFRL